MMGIAIVTGASRGIGAAVAIKLADQGHAVCVNYQSQAEPAQRIAASIITRGGNAMAVQADVASEDDVVRLFEQVSNELGPVDMLVNNAGVISEQGRLQDTTLQRFQRVMDVNVTGTFLCCREAIKYMSTANGGRGGSIVNLSSMAAKLGSPNEFIDYAASKGAVDTLTIGLAREIANQGIRVNGVRPGLIYTDIHATSGEPERVERVKGSVPMQRGGQPEEVAEAIVWLLSDQASYCTGTVIDVSGGR
jgi:NAD(P)-dependent dehydrogenase (short-subunit alcohol dehydrogenase family)